MTMKRTFIVDQCEFDEGKVGEEPNEGVGIKDPMGIELYAGPSDRQAHVQISTRRKHAA